MDYLRFNSAFFMFAMWRSAVVFVIILIPGLAHADANIISHSSVATFEGVDSLQSTDSVKRMVDTTCVCHPSLPLEIATSSLIVGVLEYEGSRVLFDDTSHGQNLGPAVIGPALLLYMLSLAPVANWTSGCDGNAWNTVWIGFLSQVACIAGYGVSYGFTHVLNLYKFNWPEYVALGVAPTVITSLVYNHFLHCRPKNGNSDQGMYLMPSVNGDKSVTMNFGMRF